MVSKSHTNNQLQLRMQVCTDLVQRIVVNDK
jgi:hypothetical protein